MPDIYYYFYTMNETNTIAHTSYVAPKIRTIALGIEASYLQATSIESGSVQGLDWDEE